MQDIDRIFAIYEYIQNCNCFLYRKTVGLRRKPQKYLNSTKSNIFKFISQIACVFDLIFAEVNKI